MSELRNLSAWAKGDISPEVERLLNPAFGCAVLAMAARRYSKQPAGHGLGLPLLLAFVVLPLVLHGRTRQSIVQHNTGYGLHRFIRTHSETLAGLDRRVQGFRAFSQAAVTFGACNGLIELDDESLHIAATPAFLRALSAADLDEDAIGTLRAADRLGAWFAGLDVPRVFLVLQLIP